MKPDDEPIIFEKEIRCSQFFSQIFFLFLRKKCCVMYVVEFINKNVKNTLEKIVPQN